MTRAEELRANLRQRKAKAVAAFEMMKIGAPQLAFAHVNGVHASPSPGGPSLASPER